MSKFKNRIASKERINGLEKAIIDILEDFSNGNPDLTLSECGAVFLKLLTDANDRELRNIS